MRRLVDRILLWDTTPDGTVSISPDEKSLITKIKLSYIAGGDIVLRPAEIFEGEDFYLKFAVDEGDEGYLYHLMQAGHAGLQLPPGMTLDERAESRFDGPVVDKGAEVIGRTALKEVRDRTQRRKEALKRAGWEAAPVQFNVSQSDASKALNDRFREMLRPVGLAYMTEAALNRSPMGEYINGDEQVQRRKFLWPRIEEEWSASVRSEKRPRFQYRCKEALTVATAIEYSRPYGSRISEFHPDTMRKYSFGYGYKEFVKEPEVQIVKAFMRVYPATIPAREKVQGRQLVEAIQHMPAREFAETVPSIIGPQDRQRLIELLYGRSNDLGKISLVEVCPLLQGDFERQLDEKVILRVEEMIREQRHDMIAFRRRLSLELGIFLDCLLLLLCPHYTIPGATTAIVYGADKLYDKFRKQDEEDDLVFGVWRKRV